MDLQMCKIGCVNYANFLKSGHIIHFCKAMNQCQFNRSSMDNGLLPQMIDYWHLPINEKITWFTHTIHIPPICIFVTINSTIYKILTLGQVTSSCRLLKKLTTLCIIRYILERQLVGCDDVLHYGSATSLSIAIYAYHN